MKYELFIIKKENCEIIPLAYNIFIYNMTSIERLPYYEKNISLQDKFSEVLESFLEDHYKKAPHSVVVIDFKNIYSCNRPFENITNRDILKKVIFVNVNDNDELSIKKRLKTCIPELKEYKNNGVNCLCIFQSVISEVEMFNFKVLYDDYILKLLADSGSIIDHSKSWLYLDSSGIYSNYYIRMKNIFYYPNMYTYVIYRLVEHISEFQDFNKIDALISTSKTGGIIATLVGAMLNKKVIHCLGIGPKNVADIENINEKIRPGKCYYLILDFICLGTEVKIINTIVTCLKASIIGGVAVSSYLDIQGNSDYITSSLGKVFPLSNINKCGIDFKVSVLKKGEISNEHRFKL